jgi:hypothetical protein
VNASVRCAGNPEVQYIRVAGAKATFANGGPCGWRGKRAKRDLPWSWPCPRCGGRVELIPPAGGDQAEEGGS